jgi:hypothetical protein
MRLRGLIFLLAFPSLACESSLSSDAVAGTFVLRRVEGDPLPAVLYTTDHSRIWVLSDTLFFRADGQGTRTTLVEIEPLNSEAPNESSARAESFSFRIVRTSIEVNLCPPNANCVAPPHLVLRPTANGLIAVSSKCSRAPLTYEQAATAR